jgi:hypothetical protein
MDQQLSKEVLSVLPYFNDNVILVFNGVKNQEYEMEILQKSNEGDLVFHQQYPAFSNDLINTEVAVLYTTKFKNMGQKVSGIVTRMNMKYIIVSLHGVSEDLPDRRMDKRFNVEDDCISFSIKNKEHQKKYKNVKPINISNTGFRFSYERCDGCKNFDLACFKHLRKEVVIDILLDFKPLKTRINVEGLIAAADFDENGNTFFVGGKFDCDPKIINKISKNIRDVEAIENYSKYRTELKDATEIKEEEGKENVGFFSGFFNKKRA